MNKIYRYELRRLLRNKIFPGILAVTLFYGWMQLTGEIILGVANTAPFSPWSYGAYLAALTPLLCLGELFFLTFFVSAQERRVARLTDATPVDRRRYALTRCAAVLTGSLLLTGAAAALGLVFYARFFGVSPSPGLLPPALLTLLPTAVFSLGLGWRLGQRRPALVYAAMAAVVVLCALPLPPALDFSLAAFFESQPRALGALDPAFAVPPAVLAGRATYLAAGALLLLAGRKNTRRT